jgi:hypothetical protein
MTSRERNMLIILAVVVVVGAAVFLLTRGGGAPEEAAPTLPTPPQVAPPVEPPPKPPRVPTFFAARDPFVPLVIVPVEGEAPPADEDGDGDVDEPPDGGPGPPTGGPPVEPPPAGDTGVQPGVTVGGRTVVVIDVFTQGGQEMVQVEVDGETFTVAEGETFAQNFETVSIEGECATFLFGDETFTTCEGGRPK